MFENRHEIEIARMTRILRSYGVLTKVRLCQLCGADHWPVNFQIALDEAIKDGRIVALGDELVELPPERAA